MYSTYLDDEGYERLFSTTEFLDESLFSEEEDDDDSIMLDPYSGEGNKLNTNDKIDLFVDKRLTRRKSRDNEVKAIKNNDYRDMIEDGTRRRVGLGAGIGALGGGLIGNRIKIGKKNRKLGVLGAAVGATLLAGHASKPNRNFENTLKKEYSQDKNKKNRRLDQIKMANGDLSREDFIKRWYNKKGK